jgi:hypothetical protein
VFKEIPIKVVVPIIVITWILSLVSSLAIVYVLPSLFSVRSEQIGEGLITSDKIADEAIITVKLADGNVTSAKIKDGNITAVDLADGSVINVKILDGAVTTSKIADKNVTTDKIADYAIVEIKLADGSVTSAKIKDGTIIAEDLNTGAVSEIKIQDYAVTTNKIADYAVTNIKLAAGAIPFNATYATNTPSTTSTNWANMSGMEVSIELSRVSDILIMFSAEAWVSVASGGNMILVKAVFVNATGTFDALPPPGSDMTILTKETANDMGTRSFNFYIPSADTTVSTIRIQWRLWTAGPTGYVRSRTLAVIALPS